MKKGFIRWVGKSMVKYLHSADFKEFSNYAFFVILIPITAVVLLVWVTGNNWLWRSLLPVSLVLAMLWFVHDAYNPTIEKGDVE